MNLNKGLMLIFVVLLSASLACNFSFSLGDPTATPSPTEPPPTDTPQPTVPPPPTQAPTVPVEPTAPPEVEPEPPGGGILNPNASASGDVYYSESFDSLDNWSVFLLKGGDEGLEYGTFDNRLRTSINTQDTYFYYMLESGPLSDVRVDIEVENRASNTNYVGIICRYSEDGWYEANILNTGEYFVYYSTGDAGGNDLYIMHKGASRLILTGQKVNNYAMVCAGESLAIIINGTEVISLPLRTGDYRFLPEGQVGLSVSTTFAIPVVVDFLQFVMTVP